MKFLYFLQDTVKKTLGLAVMIPGIMLLIIALFGIIGGDKPEDFSIGIGVSVFSLVLIIPGIILFRAGQRQSKEETLVRQLVSMLTSYRRMSLADMASKLGINEGEAQRLLNLAIDQQLVQGNMDRTTGEFFVSGSLQDIKKLTKCPYCGAPVEQIYHSGETAKCPSCGSLFR